MPLAGEWPESIEATYRIEIIHLLSQDVLYPTLWPRDGAAELTFEMDAFYPDSSISDRAAWLDNWYLTLVVRYPEPLNFTATAALLAPAAPPNRIDLINDCLSRLLSSKEAERDALIALYNAANGPNWLNDANWLSDRPLGEWHGVSVDDAGQVVVLNLAPNGLSGPIPPELGTLANLQQLNLGLNELSGSIPPELGALANLQELSLRGNELSGCIPRTLADALGDASSTGLQPC